jgi:hypothetical protein
MLNLSVLIVPGCTDLPTCRCAREMQIARLEQLLGKATRSCEYIDVLPVTTRDGLRYGLPIR